MVTVAICTRDRVADLARCLTSVVGSNYAGIEVLVIDQSTGSDCQRLVASAIGLPIRYIRNTAVGVASSRNLALGEAAGRYLFFVDDDCTVEPDWVSRGVNVMETHPSAACSFGALVPVPHDRAKGFVPAFQPARFRVRSGGFSALTFTGCTANAVVRPDACRWLGGFDAALGSGGRFRSVEDIDLACRALRAGFQVIEDPLLIVHHWGFRTYADGAARRYMRDVFYGEGARQARDLRNGGFWALGDSFYRAGTQVALSLHSLARGRITGMGRLAAYGTGFVAGARAPIDPGSGLYSPAGEQ